MSGCIVWVEGVDFDETLFDTGKLSIIRGASRAYETMPPLVVEALGKAFPDRTQTIARGASMAGVIIRDADETAVTAGLAAVLELLQTQRAKTCDVHEIGKAIKDPAADLDNEAPLGHLRFHHEVVAFASGGEAAAIERARAAVRLAQLREPGSRRRPDGGKDEPCAWDGIRAAETVVNGPGATPDASSTPYAVSAASGARWHFGRAQRQRLYRGPEKKILDRRPTAQPLAFVDDFQEMVRHPPRIEPETPLPVSVRNKICVMYADGDKFTDLRTKLKRDKGVAEGLALFTGALDAQMNALLARLVSDLADMRDGADANARQAASLAVADTDSHREIRGALGLSPDHRLLRLETLIFGGDDALFVAPAWLAWWLARAFFAETAGWQVEGEPLLFSAGMVIAPAKTPIRSLKNLAYDLMVQAKQTGGLEVEVLESLEPPAGGLEALRDGLFGKGWRDGAKSRLTVPRDRVTAHIDTLMHHWSGESPLPASPLHRALRKARQAGELAGSKAAEAAREALDFAAKRSGGLGGFTLADCGLLGASTGASEEALRLHVLLQQRDYIRAAAPWITLPQQGGAT